MKNKKGFTLIEIIIVIIIVGVLAALALPKLTNQVKVSKAAEAYQVLGSLMSKINECYVTASDDITECNTTEELTGFSLPSSNNFTYVFPGVNAVDGVTTTCSGTAATPGTCGATALLTGGAADDMIGFNIDLGTGKVTKAKGGIFKNLKN